MVSDMTDPESLERLGLGDHPSQTRLMEGDVECPICGRTDGLFIPYGDKLACVDCVTKENGEDG